MTTIQKAQNLLIRHGKDEAGRKKAANSAHKKIGKGGKEQRAFWTSVYFAIENNRV